MRKRSTHCIDSLDVAGQLKALERAKKVLDRRSHRRADWDDPGDRLVYVRELKQVKRNDLLTLLVPSRMCPSCGVVKPRTRQWVVFPRIALVRCRGPEAQRVRSAGVKGTCCACRSCVMTYFRGSIWHGQT